MELVFHFVPLLRGKDKKLNMPKTNHKSPADEISEKTEQHRKHNFPNFVDKMVSGFERILKIKRKK